MEIKQSPLSIIGFKRAFAAALESPSKHYKVGSAIYRKGRFISSGFSSPKTSPKSKRKHRNICSELHAILRAKGNTKNCHIYIVRIGKKLNLLPINPCEHCLNVMEEAGIKTYYAARSEEAFIKETI